MTDEQRNRVLGTLTAIEQIREQIARAARDGKSPAQSGRALTPLPEESWREMERTLNRASGHARDLAGRFAGEALAEREAREPVGATLYWVSFLLRRLDEEVVADLTPGQMGKFGALPDDARAALDETVEQIRGELATVRRQVDALRQERKAGA